MARNMHYVLRALRAIEEQLQHETGRAARYLKYRTNAFANLASLPTAAHAITRAQYEHRHTLTGIANAERWARIAWDAGHRERA